MTPDDNDRPRTDAEIRALTDRQAGFPDAISDAANLDARWGSGMHGSINRAIFGSGGSFLHGGEPPADFRPVSKRWSRAARYTAHRDARRSRNRSAP